MPVTKFALSVPEDVMQAVDRAARARGVTRSRLVSQVLARVARVTRDQEISRRVDEALSDPELFEEQRSTAADYRRMRPRAGTEW